MIQEISFSHIFKKKHVSRLEEKDKGNSLMSGVWCSGGHTHFFPECGKSGSEIYKYTKIVLVLLKEYIKSLNKLDSSSSSTIWHDLNFRKIRSFSRPH